jgi:EAL domain-containing protein (putative c-di-GMP-specific phosphodiesterase class I)
MDPKAEHSVAVAADASFTTSASFVHTRCDPNVYDLLGSIDFVVQDIVDPASLQVAGIEVLMRSADGPLATLRAARSMGLESALARSMAERVVGALDHDSLRMPVWFNIEPSLFSDVRTLTEVLDQFAQIPNQLVLEITERRFGQPDDLIASRRLCARRNVFVALDDFRDTDPHWARLTTLSPDAIKIDRSCIHGNGDSELASRRAATLTAALRRHYPLIVQEGVETVAQHAALPAGVLAQGYFFGRPQPLSVLTGRTIAAASDVR